MKTIIDADILGGMVAELEYASSVFCEFLLEEKGVTVDKRRVAARLVGPGLWECRYLDHVAEVRVIERISVEDEETEE